VLGVETNAAAIADARVNARDVGNVTFTHGSIDQILPTLDVTHPLVIIDPPRSGLSKAAVAGLVGLAPLRIVYVSCDPASLARDIKRLLPAGYELREVQPIDMFPQTYHTECVAILDRKTHQP
jgi:23S rRNA (uracil1939-C5)-methyltransferase